jgi:predicted P-loop ATPase
MKKLSTGEFALKSVLKSGYDIRRNMASGVVEINGVGLNSFNESKVLIAAGCFGCSNMAWLRIAIDEIAGANAYHPLALALSALQWDGQDHLTKFASYFKDTDAQIVYSDGTKQSSFYTFMKRFMLGAVAKVFDQKQNFVLVFEGKQGIGKSYISRWLCGVLPGHFVESEIHPDSKEAFEMLTSNFLWEAPEITSSVSKADVNALKSFLTLKEASWRPPYGRGSITRFATASIIGTCNDDGMGLLHDPTGNRRFACVTLDSIDKNYATECDVTQLWAQIVYMYLHGESNELLPEEKEVQVINNNAHTVANDIEYYIEKYYEIDSANDDWMMPTAVLIEQLRELRKDNETNRQYEIKLAKALKYLGCKKLQRPTRWLGIHKRVNPLQDNKLGKLFK